MVGHGGSSAGSYLADPTSPIPSHCASIVATSTLRVNGHRIWWNYKIYKVSIPIPRTYSGVECSAEGLHALNTIASYHVIPLEGAWPDFGGFCLLQVYIWELEHSWHWYCFLSPMITEWLRQVSRGHEMFCHDPEVVGWNPSPSPSLGVPSPTV